MRIRGFRWALSTAFLATAIVWLGHPAESAMAALPASCTEGGASSTHVLFCDDFESGALQGHWNGARNTWPAAFVFCGDQFGFGDRCAARSSARAVFASSPELYVRWYQYFSTTQADAAHASAPFVTLSDPSNDLTVSSAPPHRMRDLGVTLVPGRWYLFEWHVKLNSPGASDGVAELWIDDASRPIATQTLRLSRRDMQWRASRDASARLLGALRLTARDCDKATPACPDGEAASPHDSHRWDHIVVSRMPVGPLAGRVPRAPTGLKIGALAAAEFAK